MWHAYRNKKKTRIDNTSNNSKNNKKQTKCAVADYWTNFFKATKNQHLPPLPSSHYKNVNFRTETTLCDEDVKSVEVGFIDICNCLVHFISVDFISGCKRQ